MTITTVPQCPSAPPEWEGAKVFGIVAGTPERPETHYLSVPEPVTASSFADLPEPVTPREVYRIAANCIEGGCRHWTGKACSLIGRVIQKIDPVVKGLPHCRIRTICRWWDQEGPAACARCPRVLTDAVIGKAKAAAADESLAVIFL